MTWDDESMRVIWISIHSWFYASILILNILNGSLQPKLKEGNVWPFNALHAVKWLQAESVIYGHCTGTVKRNWSNSTAVISKAILRGRLLGLTGVNCAQVSVRGLWTFRPFDVSPTGRFAPSQDVLPLHRTFRHLAVSPPTVVVSPPSVDCSCSPPLVSCNFRNVHVVLR